MSDSTEQAKKPVTEDVEDHGPPPTERQGVDDAENDMRQADADQQQD